MGRPSLRLVWVLAGVLAVTGAGSAAVHAQRVWTGFYGRTPPNSRRPTTFDGSFHFCRAMFTQRPPREAGLGHRLSWRRLNFSVRLAELTKVRVDAHEGGEEFPDAVVVRLTDDALFQCPFMFMEDAGTARFTDEEVGRLREYLLKGGFLLVSDYHGTGARSSSTRRLAARCRPASSRSSTSLRPTTRCGTRCSR